VTEYTSPSPEENLASARAILHHLYALPRLPVVGETECQDCGRCQMPLEYGRMHVCRPCAHIRKRAGEWAAA